MEFGYCALRFIEKLCNTDIRFFSLFGAVHGILCALAVDPAVFPDGHAGAAVKQLAQILGVRQTHRLK